ncbi:unnamed protein product [Tuber melanosporum]|uniref:(Perigord truffle) hypothetical protein n=1 Tax=Tuber melanosporum (strain Mel28) TaxID=656061 RepID=D5GJZ8_TUBMM|nr:uncharacterized protein GSTUM_00009291001 [Tuber melanosporum]CAZ84841.1 unnamed protein product [Tuber melanosporum]
MVFFTSCFLLLHSFACSAHPHYSTYTHLLPQPNSPPASLVASFHLALIWFVCTLCVSYFVYSIHFFFPVFLAGKTAVSIITISQIFQHYPPPSPDTPIAPHHFLYRLTPALASHTPQGLTF